PVLEHPGRPDAQVGLQAVAEHQHLLVGAVGQLQLLAGYGPHREPGRPLVDAAHDGPVVGGLGAGPDGVRRRRSRRHPDQRHGQPEDEAAPAQAATAHRRPPRPRGLARASRRRSSRAAPTMSTATAEASSRPRPPRAPAPAEASSRTRLRESPPPDPAAGATPTWTYPVRASRALTWWVPGVSGLATASHVRRSAEDGSWWPPGPATAVASSG